MDNLFSIKNKTFLITGASSGIGKATACLFAKMGAKCIITGRDSTRLENVLMSLEGGGHISFKADITNSEDVKELTNDMPLLDGIIHCAGIIHLLPHKFISFDSFNKIININLYAPFFITQALLKKKKIQRNASIVFLSSISGYTIGSKGNLMYSASKSAINGMVKVLALELAEQNIRVNSISAGMVKTEMWINEKMVISEEQLALDEQKYPLGYGQPDDIAHIAAFLSSKEARWITGTNIIADGGFSIQ